MKHKATFGYPPEAVREGVMTHWTTKDGKQVRIDEMETTHLQNTITMLKSKKTVHILTDDGEIAPSHDWEAIDVMMRELNTRQLKKGSD